ncbi:myb transcription [Diplodia corticola]|uniref:Myb transcription n=1 Tax=Diplodia corticola TaxID=236234 RepID=A0A1J9SD61_9PEZI|nr:myb transcription [Diplodia corticola]OJD37509.1 myb transcription [Diplodia corticola]
MISTQHLYAQPPKARRKWTDDEDRVLHKEADLQKSHGGPSDWKTIARKLPGRSNKDCRKRWNKIRVCLAKGPWCFSEDELLKEAVRMHGLRSVWRPEEDDALLLGVTQYGKSWRVISEHFLPTRSTTDIKNRYVTIIRYRRKLERSSQVADLESNDGLDFRELQDALSASPSFSNISTLDQRSLSQTNEAIHPLEMNPWLVHSMDTSGYDTHASRNYGVMDSGTSSTISWPTCNTSNITSSPWSVPTHQPNAIASLDWLAGTGMWMTEFGESNGLVLQPDFNHYPDLIGATDGSLGLPDAHFDWQVKP